MKSRSILDSFRYAMEGLVYALQSQRHMRYLLIITVVVLVAAEVVGVSSAGLIGLALAIGMLLVAELLNAAIEAIVDLVSPAYHPLAKAAKDVGASAVLVASTIAVFITSLVILESPRVTSIFTHTKIAGGPKPLHLALVGIAVVLIAIALGKVWGRKGTLWQGGAISGHAALSAYLFVSICYKANGLLVIVMAMGLAFLVAQSRLEAGFHTLREVLIGTCTGLVVSFTLLHFLA